jgi:hypothetical protein
MLARQGQGHLAGEEPGMQAVRPAGPHATLAGGVRRDFAQVPGHRPRMTNLIGPIGHEARAQDERFEQPLDVRGLLELSESGRLCHGVYSAAMGARAMCGKSLMSAKRDSETWNRERRHNARGVYVRRCDRGRGRQAERGPRIPMHSQAGCATSDRVPANAWGRI